MATFLNVPEDVYKQTGLAPRFWLQAMGFIEFGTLFSVPSWLIKKAGQRYKGPRFNHNIYAKIPIPKKPEDFRNLNLLHEASYSITSRLFDE